MSCLKTEINKCVKALSIPVHIGQEILAAADREIEESIILRGQGKAYNFAENSLKSSDCFTSAVPSGEEIGNFYAIDLGGTNLRCVCVSLKGKGVTASTSKQLNFREANLSEDTPKGMLDKNTPATIMFDSIAQLTKESIIEAGDNPSDERPIAFTFSFPMKQYSLTSGVLMEWTKEFETGKNTDDPVEGQDCAQLLNAAFRRAKMKAYVCAITNDTVGTMLSGGYEHNSAMPTSRVGIILGTGFNICVMDPFAQAKNYSGSIINLECGNFSKLKQIQTIVDMELDYESSAPGLQLAEKMISGHYLPEMCRMWLVHVFQHRCPAGVWRNDSITAYECSMIYADDSKDLSTVKSVLKKAFDWDVTDLGHLQYVSQVIAAVFDRSAALGAILTAACAIRTRHLQEALGGVTASVDGSLYTKNKRYREALFKYMDGLLGAKSHLLHFVEANDGSGKGAAVLAACSQ